MRRVDGLDAVARDLCAAVDRSRVRCDDFLVVERESYYAQLLCDRDAVYGEVVSNTYLSGAESLTAAQEHRLTRMGWTPPEVPCHSRCPRPHPNFHRIWLGQEPTEQIVRDLLLGFLLVSDADEGGRVSLVGGPRSGHPSTGLPCHH